MRDERGISILEVILAAAIFTIFSSAAVVAVISGFNLNRTSLEQLISTQFATEGIEAVKSIKNKTPGYSNLVNSAGTGVDRDVNGTWVFGGVNDTFDSNRYTRVLKVEDVFRNAAPPSGDIITSGTLDPDTKKITSTVTWDFTPSKSDSVSLITYLSDWRKPILGSIKQGLIVYGDGTTIPKFRNYDQAANSFDSSSSTVAGSSGQYFTMRTSPTNTEAVVGYLDTGGNLQVMCYDGTTWTNEWSVSVGGTGTTRRFDIVYETNSGDVMVVYSRGVAATNALAYKTKPGSTGCGSANWAAATNFATSPTVTTGTIHWVKMARDPRPSSNTISAIWADSNSDLGVNNWSGTLWATNTSVFRTMETNLERISASQDVDSFDIVFESVSGDMMIVWGNAAGANGTNGARYAICSGGVYNCSWSGATIMPTVSDDIHNLDMSADPATDRIVYAAIGNAGDDLTAAYWSGGGWTGYANLDTTTETPFAGSKLVSTSWLINGPTTRWILNYDDGTGTGLSWYLATPGSTPAKQADFAASPAINDVRERYDADMDPTNQNQTMVTLSDSTRSVFAKRASMDAAGVVTWTNADGGSSLGTIPAVPPQGFVFNYWRNP